MMDGFSAEDIKKGLDIANDRNVTMAIYTEARKHRVYLSGLVGSLDCGNLCLLLRDALGE